MLVFLFNISLILMETPRPAIFSEAVIFFVSFFHGREKRKIIVGMIFSLSFSFFLLDEKETKNQENLIRTFPAGHSPSPQIFIAGAQELLFHYPLISKQQFCEEQAIC